MFYHPASGRSKEMEGTLVLDVIEDRKIPADHFLVSVLTLAAIVIATVSAPTVKVTVLVTSRGVSEEHDVRCCS
ncbi:hypothetical protein GCM10010446_48780 [Streptomyces enissocaesilis]|uniref:Uncharacterized protein n=1 Tax=Streptomyces enissocaesilis TaxID=332589 RepID=A0ABN3XI12_9ACTN